MPEDAAGAGRPESESALASLLAGVRRRTLLAGLLAGSLAAALLNEAVRWGSIGVNRRHTTLELPVLDVGPLFLAALVPLLLRRTRLPALAARIDARLGLRERLTSFLDFRGRADVPPEIRRAQAGETVRALAGKGAAAAAPLRPWLAAGPLLLLASLLYPLLVPTMEQPPTVRLVRRLVPGASRPPLGDGAAPEAPARGGASGDGAAPGRQEAKGGEGKSREEGAHGRQEDAAKDAGQQAEQKSADDGRSPESAPAAHGRPPQGGDSIAEPKHIESERVGTRLARVVDPVFSPGASAPPQSLPAGSLAFHLVPRGARPGGSAGAAGGEALAPERVTVDFDALPEQYRPLVRAYFEILARRPADAGAGATPVPGKEPTP